MGREAMLLRTAAVNALVKAATCTSQGDREARAAVVRRRVRRLAIFSTSTVGLLCLLLSTSYSRVRRRVLLGLHVHHVHVPR